MSSTTSPDRGELQHLPAKQLGGSLTIDSAPGRGTRVRASVPNPKRRR